MSIVPDQDIFDFLGDDDSATNAPIMIPIRNAVEDWVERYCNRTFESTAYKERYHGTGGRRLVLRNYPIVSVERLSLWPIDVIRVTNTNTTTHATVSVTSTGVVLVKDGVSNATVLFASYATMALVVAAINAIGSGWSAVIQSASYNNYLSSELIPRYGLYCLNNNWAYLQMPYFSEVEFDVDADAGIITLFRYLIEPDPTFGRELITPETVGFPHGTRNIFVYYTAGYTSANMPDDLKLAIKMMVKRIYESREESYIGLSSFNTGDTGASFETGDMPKEVFSILDKYRRFDKQFIPGV